MFTYDQRQKDHFTFDKPEEKQGLVRTCHFINTELNQRLKGLMLSSSIQLDNILFESISAGEDAG